MHEVVWFEFIYGLKFFEPRLHICNRGFTRSLDDQRPSCENLIIYFVMALVKCHMCLHSLKSRGMIEGKKLGGAPHCYCCYCAANRCRSGTSRYRSRRSNTHTASRSSNYCYRKDRRSEKKASKRWFVRVS